RLAAGPAARRGRSVAGAWRDAGAGEGCGAALPAEADGLKLKDHTRQSLLAYIVAQCATVVPDGRDAAFHAAVDAHLDEALERLRRCINACAPWRPDEFNVLQSSQHT